MFLRYVSDIHLEIVSDVEYIDNLIPPMDTDWDTVLVLLGDIHVGLGAVDFIDEIAPRFKAVIYVLGNHEFYYDGLYTLKDELQNKFKHSNVHVLENETLVIDDQKFVGCTLWTNIEEGDSECIKEVERGLNDYRLIYANGREIITADNTIAIHESSIEYLTKEVDKDTIVLTHHCPLLGLSNPQFKYSTIRGGFESNLYELILELQPKYWLYGHTHYNIGPIEVENTALLCNQAGYKGYNESFGYEPEVILDISKGGEKMKKDYFESVVDMWSPSIEEDLNITDEDDIYKLRMLLISLTKEVEKDTRHKVTDLVYSLANDIHNMNMND